MNAKNHSVFLNRFVQVAYSDGNLPNDIIESSLDAILSNLSTINHSSFLSFLNVISYRIFPFKLVSENEKLDILQECIDRFRGLNLKGKSFCLRYASKLSEITFQDDEKAQKLIKKLFVLIESESIFRKNF